MIGGGLVPLGRMTGGNGIRRADREDCEDVRTPSPTLL
jgi:hypothetical protein